MIDIYKIKTSKQFSKITSMALMGTICAASVFSVNVFARDVYIDIDDSTIHSVTLNDDVDSILDKVGVQVSDEDIVEKYDNPDGSLKLSVRRPFNVSVLDGSRQINLKMNGGKVSDALKKAGIEFGEHDLANFDLESEVKKGMKIVVVRRVKVCISADGEEKEYILPESCVENALNYAGLELYENDIINLDLSSKIYEGMKIVVNRIRFEEVTYNETVSKGTVFKKTDLLDKGVQKVTEEGKDGRRELIVRKTLKDNEVVNSEVVSSRIVQEPVNKVVLEGTREPVVRITSGSVNSSKQTEYNGSLKVLYGSATAYTAPKGARTSTGKVPVEGETVAVNPKVIPYGSKILVESNDGSYKKTLIAQDTGGALRSGSAVADIYMNSTQACKTFGRKPVKISILK